MKGDVFSESPQQCVEVSITGLGRFIEDHGLHTVVVEVSDVGHETQSTPIQVETRRVTRQPCQRKVRGGCHGMIVPVERIGVGPLMRCTKRTIGVTNAP